MNESLLHDVDDETLDRLVDGELTEQEYRRLLLTLERRPDGWRRCALAFLEAQSFQREFGAMRGEMNHAPATPARVSSGWSRTSVSIIVAASAASFALAFLIAAATFRSPHPAITTPSSPIVTRPGDVAIRETVPPSRDNQITQPRPLEPWGQYRLVVEDANGQPKEITMPVYSMEDPRANELLRESTSMPVELIQQLLQAGFQVDRQRQWAPVPQGDGRSVLVPIDDFHITPVSNRIYQ